MNKNEEKNVAGKNPDINESTVNESAGAGLAGVQQVEDITCEQFYNPALNADFSAINDDFIFLNGQGQVGMDVHVEDRSGDGGREDFKMFADSMGLLLEHYDIAVEASVEDVHDKFFRITCEPVVHKFWKGWKKVGIPTDEANDQLEEKIDDFYVNVIQDAKTPADVMNGMLAL